ncbi:DUF6286 domain-containing protein [Canibacter zhoujuaniae]|uniref:DUF6286 domain-containing protein n=1 Tax=Canibacter zhoujuaniae TaxID=2708343 RepID=UPI0014235A19|nr:DUF6286 domain-containing protein [Canibacter zhoujuaniae]
MSDKYARIIRRETNASRAVLATILAVFVILFSFWIITEILLHLLVDHYLIVPAPQMRDFLFDPATVTQPWIIGAGIVLALLGVLLVIAALKPGWQHRHTATSQNNTVVIDDRAIAGGLETTAALAAGVPIEQARATVSKRKVHIDLQPISGLQSDLNAAENAVADELDRLALTPELSVSVHVAREGKL